MPTIGQVVSQLEAQLFVGRERELAIFEQWLTAPPSLPEILNVSGPGGVGKSALLQAFRRKAEQLGRSVVLADAHDFVASPDGLLQALGCEGSADIEACFNQTHPLIMLDTFEQLGHLSTYLQQEFIPRLDSDVKLVLAGRYPLAQTWRAAGPLHSLIRSLPLGGLSPAESRTYLERRGVGDARLIDQVLRATSGHPLALSLAADMVLQFGVRDFAAAPEWRLVLRTLVERLIQDVDDPTLRELLEACSVVRQFDEATLEAVSGHADIRVPFVKLCQLSIVRPDEHGLMLHDDVRGILTNDLCWRRRDAYDELRRRALAYYRRRASNAPPAEREWLLAERFYLWENGLIQELLFGEDEPGLVWIEPGRPEDHADVLRLKALWQKQILPGLAELRPGYKEKAHFADFEALLHYPAARLRVARSPDVQAIGFNVALSLSQDSLDLVLRNPILAPLVRAYWSPAELQALPGGPESTNIFYLIQVAHAQVRPEAVNAALLRDLFGLLALGGTYLCNAALPAQKALLEAFGFERVPGVCVDSWIKDHPFEGFALDLSQIGVEPWLEARMSGRELPKALKPQDLEREVQSALLNWHDDTYLTRSPLGQMSAGTNGPAAVRDLICQGLERAQARASPDDELAYRALDLAYLRKASSHEQAAHRLAVSRTTFYRLLKRGVQGLSRALAER